MRIIKCFFISIPITAIIAYIVLKYRLWDRFKTEVFLGKQTPKEKDGISNNRPT